MIEKTEIDREFRKFEKIFSEISRWCKRESYTFDRWEKSELDQSGFNVSSNTFKLTVFWPNAGSVAPVGFHCNPSPIWTCKAVRGRSGATITDQGLSIAVKIKNADKLIISQIGTLASLQQLVEHLAGKLRGEKASESGAPNSRDRQRLSDEELAEIATGVATAAKDYRIGQNKCRAAALEIWQSKCAVTGCDVEAVLDCAHIISWNKSKTRGVRANFILLRADMHRLFDRGLLDIDPDTLVVSFADSLSQFPGQADVQKNVIIPEALKPLSAKFKSLLRQRKNEASA